MEIKTADKIIEVILFLLIGSIYCYSIVSAIIAVTILSVNPIHVYALSFCLITLFLIIFYNKYTVIGIFSMAILSMLIVIKQMKTDTVYIYIHAAIQYIRNCISFSLGYIPFENIYTTGIVSAVCIFTALYATNFMRIKFSFLMLQLLGIGVFSICFISGYYQGDLNFLLYLFTFVVLLIKKSFMTNRKTPMQNSSFYVMWCVPFCALIIATVWNLPLTGKAIDFKFLNDLVQQPYKTVSDLLYTTFNPKYFTLQSTGFAENHGRIGGNVRINNRFVMEVDAPEKVYLTGAVKDIYTGYSWVNTSENFQPFDENSAWISNVERGSMDANAVMTIDIQKNRTTTLFYPSSILSLSIDGEADTVVYADELGNMKTDELLEENAVYTINYQIMNYNSWQAKRMLKNARKGFWEEMLAGLSYSGMDRRRTERVKSILTDYFIPNAKNNYERYTLLPQTVPKRVYDLANDITVSYDNDYDKAKALETYLSQTFVYNLMPGTPPADKDFVDYFLFEKKEGYCTYYASAMAVLARCLNMPSRYIEGYVTPSEKNENGKYTITNKQAHAWVEVYFEGVGWVPFEPTSIYADNYGIIPIPPEEEQQSTEEVLGVTDSNDQEEPIEPGEFSIQKYAGDIFNETSQLPLKTKVALLIATVALLLCLFLLYKTALYILNVRKLRRLAGKEAAAAYFKKMTGVLAFYKYKKQRHETLIYYGERIGDAFYLDEEKNLIANASIIYEKAAYGEKNISDEEIKILSDAYLALVKNIKNRGKFRYALCMLNYALRSL